MRTSPITNYNPALANLQKLINNNIHILHSDPALQKIFPNGSIKTIYHRNPNLKEFLFLSRFPKIRPRNPPYTSNLCNKCDLCNNFVIQSSTFRCRVTGVLYKIRGHVSCIAKFVIYLISCKLCKEQYVGSTEKYKPPMRLHKSDNSTRCGVAKHFNGQCKGGQC